MYVCKGICVEYKMSHKPGKGGVYSHGGKRCRSCDIFIKFDGRYCPCCGSLLQQFPRHPTVRREFKGV